MEPIVELKKVVVLERCRMLGRRVMPGEIVELPVEDAIHAVNWGRASFDLTLADSLKGREHESK